MVTNHSWMTKTSPKWSVINMHKNKTYLYLYQRQQFYSKHMKERKIDLKKALSRPNSLLYSQSFSAQKKVLPSSSEVILMQKELTLCLPLTFHLPLLFNIQIKIYRRRINPWNNWQVKATSAGAFHFVGKWIDANQKEEVCVSFLHDKARDHITFRTHR